MHRSDKTEQSAGPGSSEPTPAEARTIPVASHSIESRDLFAGTREVRIHHGQEVYRLRLTSQNRLILTK